MIVTAFAQGDRATLKNLLASDVYDGFVSAIAEREGSSRHRSYLRRHRGRQADWRGGRRADGANSIRFVAELISCTRDKDGKVVEGDPTEVRTIRDVWTFAREVESRDPNWKLVATEAV